MGYATRFWDCCRPSCSNSGAATCDSGGTNKVGSSTQSACSGGSAYACYDYSPQVVDSCHAYAFAAFNSGSCGTCYQLTLTGTATHGGGPGAMMAKGKTITVQVVNIGNISANQFDIMIPGGGVGQNPNTCGGEWHLSNSALGTTYGGFLSTCEGMSSTYSTQQSCYKTACATLPSGLQAGCNFLNDWEDLADNPDVVYSQVTCPSALTNISGLH
jgi:hypothetical protein